MCAAARHEIAAPPQSQFAQRRRWRRRWQRCENFATAALLVLHWWQWVPLGVLNILCVCIKTHQNLTIDSYRVIINGGRGYVSSSKRPKLKYSPSDFSEITKQCFVYWTDNRNSVCITKLNRNLRVKVSVSKNGTNPEE